MGKVVGDKVVGFKGNTVLGGNKISLWGDLSAYDMESVMDVST